MRYSAVATLLMVLLLAAPARAQETGPRTGAQASAAALLDELVAPAEPEPDAAAVEAGTEPAGPRDAAANEVSVSTGVVAGVEAPAAAESEKEPAAEAPQEASPEEELIEIGLEKPAPPGAEVKPSEEKNLISLSLDNVPLQDVVRMFTRISGANIVAGTNLQGTVTVSLQDVEWEPALRVILDSVDMTMVEKSPGIYVIMSKEEMATEPVTVETIPLKYTTVSNVLPIVQKMLISSNASVSGFPSANSIVVQETASQISKIRETISKLDVPRPQVFIEAKFVELNDQAIKDLGINWQVLSGYTIGISRPTFSWARSRTKREGTDEYSLRTSRDYASRSYSDSDTRNRI
ncbi:MAG TPA: hypothetical protein ENG36_03080, partial [Lentisphaerae bacterium]|nr:hypothetical protein [Lentisphaerota bacterium]